MAGRPEAILRSKDVLQALMDGRSARAIAEQHGCNHQVLSALASGRRESCSAQQAEAIATAFGIPVDDLFLPGVTKRSCTEVTA